MPDRKLCLAPVLMLAALLLVSCADMESPVPPQVVASDLVISGIIQGSSTQAASAPTGLFERLAAIVLGASVRADITGLTPLANRTVELVRINESGDVVVDGIAQVVTDASGRYTFANPPEPVDSTLVIRVLAAASTEVEMHALIGGEVVDINPVSEYVYQSVLASVQDTDVALENFLGEEINALNALLTAMSPEISGELDDDEIGPAGVALYERMLASFSTAGSDDLLHRSVYSAVEFITEVWDPLYLDDGGIAANATRGGVSSLTFGDDSNVLTSGQRQNGFYLHDFSAVRDLALEEGLDDPAAFIEQLAGLLHTTSADRQLIVANSANPQVTVAGPGAVAGDGSLMIYPIDVRTPAQTEPVIPAALTLGIRVAARWQATPDPEDLQELSLLDPEGSGDGTGYNFVRLSNRLIATEDPVEGPINAISIATTNGTLSFDRDSESVVTIGEDGPFADEARIYGLLDFVPGIPVPLTLDLDTHDFLLEGAAVPVPDEWQPALLYYVFPDGGQVQLRTNDISESPPVLGHGVVTENGEVLSFTVSDGAFEPDLPEAAQSMVIAVRQHGETPAITGTYNLVEHTVYLGEGEATGTVASGYRNGIVTLVDGSIAEPPQGGFISKRVAMDLTSAQGGEAALFSRTESVALESAELAMTGAGEVDLSLSWSLEGVETTVSGTGAVSEDGTFIVIATEVEEADLDAGADGRGLLFLMRQP